jgi:hypothetical protein
LSNFHSRLTVLVVGRWSCKREHILGLASTSNPILGTSPNSTQIGVARCVINESQLCLYLLTIHAHSEVSGPISRVGPYSLANYVSNVSPTCTDVELLYFRHAIWVISNGTSNATELLKINTPVRSLLPSKEANKLNTPTAV